MPWIQHSDYQAPYWLFNGHLQTIIPSQFRKVQDISYQRERFATPDDDFLLLDWSEIQSDKLVIISHGLEGDSQRPYIKGMVRAFNRAGWDALAWNFRGCGGEINHTLRFYHSGATDDLDLVIAHALRKKSYQNIVLVGFSLGGNLTLKYLGESGSQLRPVIKAGVAFSVPLDLHSCSQQISEPANFIYNRRFLRNLKLKVSQKVIKMPDDISTEHFDKIKTLLDFDDFYTAPIHGFQDALDYYSHCSSLYYLNDIRIPTLLVNAKNDPFLSDKCYPQQMLAAHPYIFLETPTQGGHVGFMPRGAKANDNYWSEKRALAFAASNLEGSHI
ncbi:putative alpha/beta-fold hydrolase [Catalinimonas alkaloidigena]|uniref:YheT family hydrolase n=1 Tax=Catalinimonas alkaloidigena TaxID=1075417 RepID=UPI002404DCF5|nr:alpha/beta fold hydrolase [Catalinimonas alkaloidigena]MDF9796992.1 putative alpha/beta-fold hydrolase [Catalinimonas alkaloidigena]